MDPVLALPCKKHIFVNKNLTGGGASLRTPTFWSLMDPRLDLETLGSSVIIADAKTFSIGFVTKSGQISTSADMFTKVSNK